MEQLAERQRLAQQRLEQRIVSLQLHHIKSPKRSKAKTEEEKEIEDEVLPAFITPSSSPFPIPTATVTVQITQPLTQENLEEKTQEEVFQHEEDVDGIRNSSNENGQKLEQNNHQLASNILSTSNGQQTPTSAGPTPEFPNKARHDADTSTEAFLQALREDLMVDNPIIEEKNAEFTHHQSPSIYYEHENSFFSRFPFSIPTNPNPKLSSATSSSTTLSPFGAPLNSQPHSPYPFYSNFQTDPLIASHEDESRINDGFYTAPRIDMNPKLITKVVGRILREYFYRHTKDLQKWWNLNAVQQPAENQPLLSSPSTTTSPDNPPQTPHESRIGSTSLSDNRILKPIESSSENNILAHAFNDPNGFKLTPSLSTVTEKSFKPTGDCQYRQSRLDLNIISPVFTNIASRLSFNIFVGSIVFHEHPLFTDEDRLCSSLRLCYEEFKRREAVDLARFYIDRIVGLRSKVALLQKELSEHNEKLSMLQIDSNSSSFSETNITRALIQTLAELKEARIQRDQEEYETRVLFKQLYSKWLAIRQWRVNRGQEMAALGFTIPTIAASAPDTDKAASSSALTENAMAQLPQPEIKIPNGPLYIGRPTQLKVRQLRVLPKKEKRLWREDLANELEESLLLEKLKRQSAKEASNSNPEEISKVLYEQIDSRMKKMRRIPGKAHYSPYLSYTAACLPTISCVPIERKRRAEIEGTKYYLKLFVNGKFVRRSEDTSLTFPDFTLHNDMNTHLKLLAFPSSVSLHLMQCKPLGVDEKVAILNVPIPGISSSASQQEIIFGGRRIADDETMRFKTFGPSASTISMMNPNVGNTPDTSEIRYIQGALDAAVFWKLASGNTELVTDNDGITATGFDQAKENAMKDTRRRIAELSDLGARLDPNDPRNASLLELIRRQQHTRSHKQTFQASAQNSEIFLIHDKEYKASMRKTILQVRKVCGISSNDVVPLKDQDINENLLNALKHGMSAGGSSNGIDQVATTFVEDSKDPMKTRTRIDTFDIASNWQEKAKLLHLQPAITSVEEVVNESPLPDFTFQFAFLSSLFKPRRGLQVERKRNIMSSPSTCSLIVQIVGGHNLPIKSSSKSQGLLENEPLVRTIVTVSFQSQTRTTSAAVGVHPHWNEVLTLPLASANIRTISTLQDNICFEVYDEIVHEGKMDPYHPKTIMQTTEHRWLGGFAIPFSAIATVGFMEGRFHIQIPTLHIGYERMDALSDSHIHAYITVDPATTLGTGARLVDEANLEDNIHPFYAQCVQWWKSLPKLQTDSLASIRPMLPIVRDIHGQVQLACRYLTPIAPPVGFESPSLFTRFVSQIPFSEDVHMKDGIKIWCSVHEFLSLASGDWEEHATLLACYFLHHEQSNTGSGWQTYVVLGRAFPDGDVAYVLRLGRIGNDVVNEQLINPVTGRIYSCRRPEDMRACPLKSISTVISSNNIHYNLQPSSFITSTPVIQVDLNLSSTFSPNGSALNSTITNPSLHFALDNRSFWQPLFHDNFNLTTISSQYHLNLTSLQTPLSYHYETQDYYIKRANIIHGILEHEFEKWRPRPTRWDHNISQLLNELLKGCEECEQHVVDDFPFRKQLALLTTSYSQLYGFPLHICEAGNDSILKHSEDNPLIRALFQTKMHENEDENCVFSLGVHAHPYPNRIASIWIYIVAMRI